MIVVKYPPIKQGEREIEIKVRYNDYGMCRVSRELMEKLIESYREMVRKDREQKDREYEVRRQTIEKCAEIMSNHMRCFDCPLDCNEADLDSCRKNLRLYLKNLME